MASLMPNGRQQYPDNNGNPLAGGRVYTYEAGSSTPLPTYANAAGTVENTNPVLLNARGEANIWWGDAPYKVVVKDASDVEIYTQDDMQAPVGRADLASSTSGKGAALVGFDGATIADFLKSKSARVVTSLAALKALDKTRFTVALLADSASGLATYHYDAADTTSTGNDRDVVVATDGGRWKTYQPRAYLKDGTAQHVEVIKDSAPLNYATTRAAYVVQHRDAASGAANELIPGAVFQFNASGNGTVNAASELSQTIWQGLYAYMNKTGDGSAHSFTAIGQLGAYGAGAYNELGLFQGEGTNTGSALGTMSGVEMLLKDSPDSGATTYSTKMQAVVGRIAKFNATTRKSHNFYASSEGNQPPNGVLGVNPNGYKTWQRGIDFEGAVFSTGQWALAPNNTSLAWLDAAGAARPIVGLSSTNVTYLRPGSAAASLDLQDFAGTTRLQVTGAGGVALLNATVAASATAGGNTLPANPAGFVQLSINGGNVKIPYYNV